MAEGGSGVNDRHKMLALARAYDHLRQERRDLSLLPAERRAIGHIRENLTAMQVSIEDLECTLSGAMRALGEDIWRWKIQMNAGLVGPSLAEYLALLMDSEECGDET